MNVTDGTAGSQKTTLTSRTIKKRIVTHVSDINYGISNGNCTEKMTSSIEIEITCYDLSFQISSAGPEKAVR